MARLTVKGISQTVALGLAASFTTTLAAIVVPIFIRKYLYPNDPSLSEVHTTKPLGVGLDVGELHRGFKESD